MLYAVSSYNPETFFDKDVPIKFRQYTEYSNMLKEKENCLSL